MCSQRRKTGRWLPIHFNNNLDVKLTFQNHSSHITTLVRVLCAILHQEKVLSNLRRIQQMDYLDIGALRVLFS